MSTPIRRIDARDVRPGMVLTTSGRDRLVVQAVTPLQADRVQITYARDGETVEIELDGYAPVQAVVGGDQR